MAIPSGVRKLLSPDFFSGANSPVDYYPSNSTADIDPYSPSRSGSDSDHVTPHAITAMNPTSPGEANFGPNPKDAYAPNLGIATRQPDVIRDVYAPQLAEAGSRLESAYSAPRPGMLRQVLGAIASRRNPALGGLISGETQRERAIEPLENQYKIVSSQLTAARAQQNQEVKNRLDLSTAGKNEAETAVIPQKTAADLAKDAAATEASYYKDDPNMGLIDLRTKQPVAGNNSAPLTADEAQVLGKQPGERVPLKLKNTANEIVNRGYTTANTEQGVFERRRGQAGPGQRLGDNPRMMFAPGEQYAGAVDPNDPSRVVLKKKGQIAAQGLELPQSADAVTAKKTAAAMAPGGKVGEEINAFNTALQHADLLEQAAKELKNPNSRTLAGIQNRLKTEFGDPDITNFNTIANAYSREVTKMLSGGHMTDSEIKDQGATLPSNANLETIQKVLRSYRALAQSKMAQRQRQVQQGLKGKADFPAETSAPAPSAATHRFNPATGQIEAIQ